ncbi:MAG: hypothetical protein ACXWLM_13005, partial [Myxococcales bacterium]
MGARSCSIVLVSLCLSCGEGNRSGAPAAGTAARASTAGPKALQVGNWRGKAGAFATIQSAVDAASPGDWILIAPGTYKESVLVTTPGIHLRGLDRNGVTVDGTAP